MDNSRFIFSSLSERIEFMINAMKEKEKTFDPVKMLTGSVADKVKMIIESQEQKEKNPNYYFTASLAEQMPYIIKQIELNKEPMNLAKVLTGNLSDYAKLIEKSIKDDDDKTAWSASMPFFQQIPFVLKQIEKEVEEKRIADLEEVQLYIKLLENTKEYIKSDLRKTPLDDKAEIDSLLDKLSPILKKIEVKFQEEAKLKSK
jgi:hypothetical protein